MMRVYAMMGRLTVSMISVFMLLGLISGSAKAQVSLIAAPFSGDLLETWEGFPGYNVNGVLPNPTDIFGGAASISHLRMFVFHPLSGAGWGLALNGSAQPADGVKGLGVDAQNAMTVITFDEAVTAFGAFWGAARGQGNTDDIAVEFRDASNGVIDLKVLDTPDVANGALFWQGWSSPTPIKTILYTGDFVAVDSLRAISMSRGDSAAAPEPITLTLLTLGIVGGVAAWRQK